MFLATKTSYNFSYLSQEDEDVEEDDDEEKEEDEEDMSTWRLTFTIRTRPMSDDEILPTRPRMRR